MENISLFYLKNNKHNTINAEIEANKSAKKILNDNKKGKNKIKVINNLSKLFVLLTNWVKIIFIWMIFLYISQLYVNYLKQYKITNVRVYEF